uniref:BAR domain-containing protein n=1 Tax=Bartheletia paradoxa TaxID=669517 RepID=A0A2D0XHU0_9BASI|nr:hypothetical protein SPAR03152 [Bartheletia paradoxa]
MKGITKAIKRTPHMLGSKVGFGTKSSDPEVDDLVRRFTIIEGATEKIVKDAAVFRDAVQAMLVAGAGFGHAFNQIFQPIGTEFAADMEKKHPESATTIANLSLYQGHMDDLRETLVPELELIDSRVIAPVKELIEIVKKTRKTLTKRDHKLTDYDRFNNSLTKLRDKKEKSLSDEKNLFKLEQDFEIADAEYSQYNNMLRTELPRFLELTTHFISPLFHSFYYMQLNVYYLMLDKLTQFADGKYDLVHGDAESCYLARQTGAAEAIEELTIGKRMVSTAKYIQTRRAASGSEAGGSGLGRSGSTTSYASSDRKTSYAPPDRKTSFVAPPAYAPPPASSASSSTGSIATKRPPPPPPIKPKPSNIPPAEYVTALYDFAAVADGDLDFKVGDRIMVVERSQSAEDWWTGKINGKTGVFPGNYVQLQ